MKINCVHQQIYFLIKIYLKFQNLWVTLLLPQTNYSSLVFEEASGRHYFSSKQVLSSCLITLVLLSDGRGIPHLHKVFVLWTDEICAMQATPSSLPLWSKSPQLVSTLFVSNYHRSRRRGSAEGVCLRVWLSATVHKGISCFNMQKKMSNLWLCTLISSLAMCEHVSVLFYLGSTCSGFISLCAQMCPYSMQHLQTESHESSECLLFTCSISV